MGTKPTFKKIDITNKEDVIKDVPTNELIQQLRDSLRYSKYQIKQQT